MKTTGDITAPDITMEDFDVHRIRDDFPILSRRVNKKSLVYLDNAATTQKPQIVMEAVSEYYRGYNSNIHRGVHFLSQKATGEYEESRKKIGYFINAGSEREIVFVRGTTEAINLVANSYVRKSLNLKKGDEIVISHIEHHSNIVPWQIICEETGASLKVIPVNDRGELILEEYEKLLGPKTRFVSVVHISNALGTINPVKEMVKMAHEKGIPVLIDGAQGVSHMPVDVRDLDCDFYAFSGHKLFGPTGIGVLYAKKELLETMPPYQGGGDMIKSVRFEKTVYNDIPYKFEAGTPNIAGAIGLGVAADYVSKIGLARIFEYERNLLNYAEDRVSEIKKLRVIGTAKEKSAILSFIIEGIHPHDIGTIIDNEGIAIRTGHHCSQPVMERFGIPATSRASFAMYNTKDEADYLVESIHKVFQVFK